MKSSSEEELSEGDEEMLEGGSMGGRLINFGVGSASSWS